MTLKRFQDLTVAQMLPTWLYLCLIIYLAFLVVEPFTVAPSLVFTDLFIRSVSTLGIGVAIQLSRTRGVPPEKADSLAGLLGVYVFTVTLADFMFLGDPYFDLYVQLLNIAVGMVTLSLRTAISVWSLMLVCWVGAYGALRMPLHHEQILLTAASLAVGTHSLLLRRRVCADNWSNLEKEDHIRLELAEALEAADLAKSLLDAEVAQASSEVSQAIEEIVVNREERSRLHRNLLHANRLSALGRMAAGLAHRLNNRLLVLMGTVDCIETDQSDQFESEIISEVRTALERGARLAAQLLPLTGKQHINPETVTAQDLLEEFSTLLKRTQAPLQICDYTHQAHILVDRDAWFHIVFNLVKNADQMTPPNEVIKLNVYEEDNAVVFSVEDKGPGVPKEFREKIFEPFFTTKEKTGGTGLGLSIVLGLVEQLGGQLSVTQCASGGAKFSVYFDCVPAIQDQDTRPDENEKDDTLRGRSVLVVEDDPKVLRILKRYLQDFGLDVATAQDGLEGLQKFAQNPATLVITDVVMPNMDGPTLVRELWRLDPALKVLFTSGYSDARLKEESLNSGEFEFLPKPYTRETLVKTLQKVLETQT